MVIVVIVMQKIKKLMKDEKRMEWNIKLDSSFLFPFS